MYTVSLSGFLNYGVINYFDIVDIILMTRISKNVKF